MIEQILQYLFAGVILVFIIYTGMDSDGEDEKDKRDSKSNGGDDDE